MRSKFIITITVIIIMAIIFSNSFADEFLQYFEKAQEQVSQKRYEQAAELFEAAAAFASVAEDEQTALYWVGVSYFKEGRSEPENAIRAFEQFLAKYKDSELKGEVNYFLGRCHVRRAARRDGEEKALEITAARQAFEEALNAHPGETLIQKIRMMQAVLATLNGESASEELLKEALEDEFPTPRLIAAQALGIRLPDTYQISGRIIDPQEQPIPGAKIEGWGGLPHTYTETDGQFKLSNLALWQTWLIVSARGFAKAKVVVDVPEIGELSDMEIQLRYEATITGRVIDEQGNPIAGANIHYFVNGEGLGNNITGIDGHYLLTGIDPQYLNYELMADHPDYAPRYIGEIQISAPAEVQAPDMVLKKGRNIFGVVTDEAGKPIPFATVEHPGFQGQVKADLQGQYRLKNIPDSMMPIRIRAYALGFAPVLKEISANQQDSVADFVLGKGYTLSGQVTDSEGKPLKDASVSVYVHNWHKPLIPNSQTDEAGRFTMGNVPAGEIQLHASKDGYNTAYVQHTVEGNATNLSLVLTPKSAFQVKIKVVDAKTNQAIPAFEWALTESNHIASKPRYELRQSADGTLEYFANEAGKIYDVFVRTEGYAPAVVREVRAVSQNEVKTVIVKLQRPTVVEGKVIADTTGTPVPNARVQAFNEDHPITVSNDEEFNRPGYATAFTDANGRFSINVISPATDYLYITHPEVGATVVAIAQIEDKQIRLTKDASIHGQVLQDGKPVSGAHVYSEDILLGVQQESQYPLRHEMHIWTSEDGRFAFEHLLPGEYTVGWNNRFRKLELSTGETAIITYGEAGGVDVFGTVRDENGKSVSGITVTISQQGSAETDEQGQYIIHDVPPGKYSVFAFSVKQPIKLPFKHAFKEEIEVPKGRERFQFDIVIKLEDVR